MILNRRNVKREDEKVAELADDFKTSVVGTLSRSEQVPFGGGEAADPSGGFSGQ